MRGLNPSNAHRWGVCPASVRLSQPFLGAALKKPYAEEGERMHAICESLIKREPMPACTKEEAREAEAAVQYLPQGGEAEVAFAVPYPFSGMTGRADFVHFADGVLTIADFKWGYSSVEAEHNPQLILSAYALIEGREVQTVRLIIIQPRALDVPVKEWSVSALMIPLFIAELAKKFEEAQSENPEAKAGGHCTYCPAAHACATIQSYTSEAIDLSSALTGTTPAELGRRLSLVERASEGIKNMQRALEAHVEVLLEAGTPVDGYELKDSLGHRQWSENPERLEGLAALAGIDLYERKLISPAEATRRGIPKGFQEAWTTRKVTKKVTKVKIV